MTFLSEQFVKKGIWTKFGTSIWSYGVWGILKITTVYPRAIETIFPLYVNADFDCMIATMITQALSDTQASDFLCNRLVWNAQSWYRFMYEAVLSSKENWKLRDSIGIWHIVLQFRMTYSVLSYLNLVSICAMQFIWNTSKPRRNIRHFTYEISKYHLNTKISIELSPKFLPTDL